MHIHTCLLRATIPTGEEELILNFKERGLLDSDHIGLLWRNLGTRLRASCVKEEEEERRV
jgi:hypothetical protein